MSSDTSETEFDSIGDTHELIQLKLAHKSKESNRTTRFVCLPVFLLISSPFLFLLWNILPSLLVDFQISNVPKGSTCVAITNLNGNQIEPLRSGWYWVEFLYCTRSYVYPLPSTPRAAPEHEGMISACGIVWPPGDRVGIVMKHENQLSFYRVSPTILQQIQFTFFGGTFPINLSECPKSDFSNEQMDKLCAEGIVGVK